MSDGRGWNGKQREGDFVLCCDAGAVLALNTVVIDRCVYLAAHRHYGALRREGPWQLG